MSKTQATVPSAGGDRTRLVHLADRYERGRDYHQHNGDWESFQADHPAREYLTPALHQRR
jgi:hypothetical protein